MARYQVPQFIEVEDKIFGPLTFKQFVYLAGGAAGIYLLFRLLPNFVAFLLALPVGAFSGALAFYKINDKPFIHIVEAAFKYVSSSRLYVWKKEMEKKKEKKDDKMPNESPQVPKLSDSKLKDLAWSLDINENLEQ